MKKRRWFKRLAWGSLGAVVIGAFFVWQTNRAVLSSADGRIFTDAEAIPKMPVALVLGTSPRTKNGKNLFFERRMDAAAKLYREGRVGKLLVSGDNGTRHYDEPTAMQEALVARGIPAKDIVKDSAGFRTLDSVIRAKRIFGVNRCAIVTDDFHLPRALYIAREEGIDAIGYQTQPLPRSLAPTTYAREVAARCLVWIDVRVLRREPKFLGNKEPIE